MQNHRRKLHIALFAVYAALMLWLLLHRSGYVDGIPYLQQLKANLIPFRTVRLFVRLLSHHRPHLVRAAVINLVGNVIMFIPLGLFLPLIFRKLRKWHKTLLCAALIITAVEIAQLLTLVGSCDVDDLILNLAGSTAGYILYKIISK